MAIDDNEKSSVSEHREEVDRTMTNDDVDHIAASAVGGDLADMPKGYYTNWRFIGSVAAVSFMAQGLYLGTLFTVDAMEFDLTHTTQATYFQPTPSV